MIGEHGEAAATGTEGGALDANGGDVGGRVGKADGDRAGASRAATARPASGATTNISRATRRHC